MQYLSEGWPSQYNPDTLTRLASGRYVEATALYTLSSQHVGAIRNHLIELAAVANMQPPLTRQDIRLDKRRDEIEQKLGLTGIALLAEHQTAVESNHKAMSSLCSEAYRLVR